MRSFVFSICIAALAAGCGPKRTPETPASPTADIELLEVRRNVALEAPGRPPGPRQRLAASDTGDLYVLDTDNHRVLRYSDGGRLLGTVGGAGTGPLEFSSPFDLDTDGLTLWILDRQNRRIVRLDRELNYIEEISLSATGAELSAPIWFDAIASATNGDIFLLDRREPQAVRISPAGDVLATYGGFGSGTARLESPADLAAGPDGSLFIADGRRVLRFDRSGNLAAAYDYTEPIVALEASGSSVWLLTASGQVARAGLGSIQRAVIDPAAGSPQPVDISVGRAGWPMLLDRGFACWQLVGPASE